MSDSQPVVLVVSFRAHASTFDELRTRLEEMVRLTTPDAGCINYMLHTDDNDPLRLTFVETWATDAHHAAHDLTPHVQAIIADTPRLTSEPALVQRLRRVA